MQSLFGKTGRSFVVEQPFHCDYGYNIEIGENFFANFNCVILDEAAVRFGDNVFIGPFLPQRFACGIVLAEN